MSALRHSPRLLILATAVLWLSSTQVVAAGETASIVLAPGSFLDDGESVHEVNIEALAAAGITKGCNPPDNNHYCPNATTTRSEMATFLTRALNLPPATTDYFTDDTGSPHEANINAIAAAGITKGCNPPDNDHYCPTAETTRGQMATFLTRALNLPRPQTWPMVHDADDDGIPGSSWAWRLAVGDLGYVAAGPVLAVHQDAAVWTSPDGLNWTYIPNTDYLFGGGRATASVGDVAAGNGAMVAAGSWYTSYNDGYDTDAAVWVSTDSINWIRVPHDAAVFGDPGRDSQSMHDVVFHDAMGFVAVGTESFKDTYVGNDPNDSIAAVWTSPDGLTWSRAKDTTGALEGSRTQSMHLVAADSNGYVAIGADGHGDIPAFWWSADGAAWTRSPDPIGIPEFDWFRITDVSTGPSGYVAVGYEATDNQRLPVTYTSVDGQDWVRSTPALGGPVSGITSDGKSYFAAGTVANDISIGLYVWESADGLTWETAGTIGRGATDPSIKSVLATDIGLLIGGMHRPEGLTRGAIWLRP